MPPADALLDCTAGEIVAALAARKLGALELADAAIARIEARDGPINAIPVRDFERARAAARAADAALSRGERVPLLGLPMTVKESNNVAGLPTTWGFPEAKDFVPSADSTAVQRLKAAGAVILGKSNAHRGLDDWQCFNPLYGRTNNPHDLARTPGGSSGGAAAALAAGMVPLELGSDIGGSIRMPATFCGVFGHKPTYGLVPTRGHAPPGLDGAPVPIAVVGPMARCAADLALALDVLAGPGEAAAHALRLDLPPPRCTRLKDCRILVIETHPRAAASEEVRAGLADLAHRLEGVGAQVSRSSPLLPDLSQGYDIFNSLLGIVFSRGGPPPKSPASAQAWLDLLDKQLAVRRQWAQLFEAYDVVLAAPFGTTALPHHEGPDEGERQLTIDGKPARYGRQITWAAIAGLANLPATAAPIGRTAAGLPLGVQIIGPEYEDRTTIAVAGMIEREWGGAVRVEG